MESTALSPSEQTLLSLSHFIFYPETLPASLPPAWASLATLRPTSPLPRLPSSPLLLLNTPLSFNAHLM